jgi:hypothetical protein
VTVITFAAVPVVIILPVIPGHQDVVPRAPAIVIVVAEIVVESHITVVIRKMHGTQRNEIRSGHPMEVGEVHVVPEGKTRDHKYMGPHQHEIDIGPVMMEIIDISPAAFDMVGRITVPEFVIGIGKVFVDIIPVIISILCLCNPAG